MNYKIVANGGSAIGEAIGARMEIVLQEFIKGLMNKYNCHFLTSSGYNPQTGKTKKKLLLKDNFGNDYNIDGVITDEHMCPLVLLESKYIRYKKHNRDKGSWICNAHSAIRRRYASIRGSIAVLAGNWSKTSILMMESSDVNIFLIQFDYIVSLLKEKGIDFNWDENDSSKAREAWNKYSQLSEDDKTDIAEKMINVVKINIEKVLDSLLQPEISREVKYIIAEIHASTGEIRRLRFKTVSEALAFFEDFSIDEVFESACFLTILDEYPADDLFNN